MRSKLLISTAALLAGVALASAQNMPGGGREQGPAHSQGAQSQGAQGGAAGQKGEQGRGGQAQQGTQGQSKPGQSQRNQTTGQAPQREQGMQGRGAQPEKGQPEKGQPQRSQQRERDHTTGQSPSQTQQAPQRQQGQQGQQAQPPQGQTQQRQPAQPPQGQAQQGQAGGGVTLTTEQRSQIRQTVLAGGNVPRASNVNFALTVGTTVPTSVRVVEVAPVLVEIYPQWRGFFYFVVGDEIIIVDRNHRIVAVIAV
jgi:hypothetical protein